MLIVLLVLAGIAVFVTAAIAVGAAVNRTAAQPPPAVLLLDDAVEWIADRLPFEVAAEISHGDVRRILLWHLDYFETIGLAAPHGAELGGEVVPVDQLDVVADEDAAVDYAMERAAAEHSDISPLHVVCVLDLQMQYLRSIGAVGIEADTDEQG
jgi:hypothetical protein